MFEPVHFNNGHLYVLPVLRRNCGKKHFENVSPLDYRYRDPDVAGYLSEQAFIRYKLMVELALVRTLCDRGLCDEAVCTEVEQACAQITAKEVYAEEAFIHHDIRALVNCIQRRVSEEARPYIHMMATSFDISDTANAARYRDVMQFIVLPTLTELVKVLISIARREARTPQIGRTHGQHAVPITFGFSIAEYVHRLGTCCLSMSKASHSLVGKFSGAVGAYNASSLFLEDPHAFEREVLAKLDLKPARHSTQIVAPEPMARLLSEVVLTAGALANLSRDMRNLQRTEIGEVGEGFASSQVGSSTMPQKRNPINFENVESLYKVIVGRMMTVYLDQISEHQRDLTNSASARTYAEMLCYLVSMTKRLIKTMGKLRVDHGNLQRNLGLQSDLTAAEPLYLILASLGHPDPHEKVRGLTIKAQSDSVPLQELARDDEELRPYFERMNDQQTRIILDPELYLGTAIGKTFDVCRYWSQELNIG